MKILHIINSLQKGGAEGNLYRLCKFYKNKYEDKIEIIIVTLLDEGFYETELKKIGIKTISLKFNGKRNLIELIKKIFELRNLLKKHSPDIIQSWMYHSNFLTIFMPKEFYHKIYWNIRHSVLDIRISKKTTVIISLICAFFSRYIPKKIIYCSKKSINFHEKKHFYNKKRTVLIYNGYDDKTYYSSNSKRLKFRKKNKLKISDIIIGFAGRYTKEKNIYALLSGFSKTIKKHNNVYLCMAGKNINTLNIELMNYIIDLKIRERVIILDIQRNLLEFYNGIDLLLLTSHSESFPNVVAEAMLCSTPVLSSDVGSSKRIIGNYGFVMKKNDHLSIFNNLNNCINFYRNKPYKWKILKKKSQLKIKKEFSIKKMANNYIFNWNL